ncbi:hypothetical protein HXX76_007373 [Chlamydomonas incerta]|uniref:Uncharacterized protein n=1 Tax=Chlamydomonas incerta TaxID=51695 RepID=A0A835VZR9_CHLIN|nr:hypothetical protein HXX76_007373 [Chlamydomonas incerta]|eukprot:KAG2435297.1 hypothetical protein HXX76_007373 [Chlamydomonas incerta]
MPEGPAAAAELQQPSNCSGNAYCATPRPPASEHEMPYLDVDNVVQSSGSGGCGSHGAMELVAPSQGEAGAAERAAAGGQLALTRSRTSWALAELAAAPPDAGVVEARRAALAARRVDAERFHFKWVVTGRAAASGPGSHLVCSGSSSARHTQLAVAGAGGYRGSSSGPGHEVVRVGPTTNFVGDAMSTAAVDLVLHLSAAPPRVPVDRAVTVAPEAVPLAATWAALATRRGRNGEPGAAELSELRRAARRLLGRG